MTAPAPTPHRSSTDDPALRDALMAVVDFGVRITRVTAEVAEVDGRIVALVATQLLASMDAGSVTEAQYAGHAIDSVDMALTQASPRLAKTAQAYETAARTVRRTAALIQRIACGWPRRGGSDNRQAMARRQVARSVGERITRHADHEAAERLFDDLHERLDTLEFDGDLERPVGELIEAICRDLGLPPEGPPRHAQAAEPPARAGTIPDG